GSPLGMKGIGEIGITGAAAAIANAVFHATGKRIRDYPITRDSCYDLRLIQSSSMWKWIFLCAVLCAMTLSGQALDQKDVEYGSPGGKALLLDLHMPEGPGPFPAAILVHGGGFDAGSKSTNVRPLFDVLANAGFAWFSIDYRMAPEFRFPQAIEDMDAAIRWVKANAAKYHVDASRIVIAGESAGGFLVNYAATHETPE